ncbi:MAG: CaiB/BaiF CoA-transferase family protein [Myxococcota bacterium]
MGLPRSAARGPDVVALAGLRVVDLSRLLPGPYASLVLADMGAEVVKVEAPDGGDYLRWMPPLTSPSTPRRPNPPGLRARQPGERRRRGGQRRPGPSSRSTPRARSRSISRSRLAAEADVVLESFRPGVMDRLGTATPRFAAENPRLIYCALTGYGQTGPYRDAPGHDLNYMGLGGALGLGGPADRAPNVLPVQVADIGGSLWALVAILSALHARHETGKGRFLDVSMTDGVTGFLSAALAPHIGAGTPPPKRGADVLTGGQPCYQTYATADGGFVSVAPLEPKFWAAFVATVGHPEWARRQFDPSLKAEVEAMFLTRSRAEWEALLSKSEACVEPVLAPHELAQHPLHQARGLVVEASNGLRRLRTPTRSPDAPPPGPAPGLGADTRDILARLGYDAAAIDHLTRTKVVGA